MISNRFLLIGLYAVVAALALIVIADDGMASCQSLHSFDVCHDSLH